MPAASQDESENHNEELSLISEGSSQIQARIILKCPTCGYHRTFKNVFSRDKIELVVVTLKIVDWLSCERCGDLLNSEVEYTI